MSKLRCACGNVIRDQTVDLPYKALFFADADYEAFEKFVDFCGDLIRAREAGRQIEFVKQHFGEGYPSDLDITDIISDDLAGLRAVFGHTMYECETCGRLWINNIIGNNDYYPYVPEGEARGILRSDRHKK